MPSKKKGKAASPAVPSANDEVTADGSQVLTLQLCDVSSPAGSTMLHWEALRRLGASLGDTVLVESSATQYRLILTAWASARVLNSRISLAEEAKSALGWRPGATGFTLHVRLASSGCVSTAARLSVRAVHDTQWDADADEDETHQGHLQHWVSSQLRGVPVAAGCTLPVRYRGRPLLLQVMDLTAHGAHVTTPALREQPGRAGTLTMASPSSPSAPSPALSAPSPALSAPSPAPSSPSGGPAASTADDGEGGRAFQVLRVHSSTLVALVPAHEGPSLLSMASTPVQSPLAAHPAPPAPPPSASRKAASHFVAGMGEVVGRVR